MLTKNINFKNFKGKKINKSLIKELNLFFKNNSELFKSLNNKYRYSYSKKLISKFIKMPVLRVIGMGGSILGTEAIYDFLSHKIKKKVIFVNNLKKNIKKFSSNYKTLNLIVSKSGNTLETISNVNLLIKNDDKNIFITENNNNNYLKKLAEKIKAEIIDHNNFIGGRYSVLSEVGMLPAELMGLDERKFKQLNNLIKNKMFLEQLLVNVSNICNLNKNKNLNSIILNYDERSDNLFKWYQQLVAESLGKKSKGILPIVSSLPKDNHSTMQLYLDGPKNFFYTFFLFQKKIQKRLIVIIS